MRKIAAFLFLAVTLPGFVAAGGEKVLLVDKVDGSGPKLGTGWETYIDENNLGTKINPFTLETTGNPQGAKGHGHFSGHVGKNKAPWPWAVVDLGFGDDAPKDLSAYKSLRFWAKGDGKKHRVRIGRVAIEDYCDYEQVFVAPKEWTRVMLPLAEFAQPKWGKQVERGYKDVNKVGFVALNSGDDEDFQLRFAEIEFVDR